jgi:hypothetical protein
MAPFQAKGEKEDEMVTAAGCIPVRQVVVRAGKSRRNDRSVELLAREAVERQSHFHGRVDRFEFVHREDVLVVRGAVPSFYLKQILQSALKGLQGVRWIDNQVAVVAFDGLSSVGDESATCTAG